jgi:tetratricopeptide (TPR) repeat protein
MCLENALQIHTRENNPYEWAKIQNILAINYIKKYSIHHDPITYTNFSSKNIDSWEDMIGKMAREKNVKVIDIAQMAREENVEKAIRCLENVLQIHTRENNPYEWARIKGYLALAYKDRIKGNKGYNLEKAIAFYHNALEIFTYETFPVEWAGIQNNLGNIYLERMKGDKSENIDKAIVYLGDALKIYTKENDPLNCLGIVNNLAKFYYNQKQWQLATEAYHTAIEALEKARLETLNPQSRQEVLANTIGVFHGIIQAYLYHNQPEKA